MKHIQKTFISSEICSSFRSTLKELMLFQSTEIVVAADWIGKSLTDHEQITYIQTLKPNLLITSNKKLAVNLPTLKIIVFENKDDSLDIIFLTNLFHIKAFLKSPSALLNI